MNTNSNIENNQQHPQGTILRQVHYRLLELALFYLLIRWGIDLPQWLLSQHMLLVVAWFICWF